VVDVETREPLEVGKDLEGELCIRGPQVRGGKRGRRVRGCVYIVLCVCVRGTIHYTIHTTRLAPTTQYALNGPKT
jgi:hypothetical protein